MFDFGAAAGFAGYVGVVISTIAITYGQIQKNRIQDLRENNIDLRADSNYFSDMVDWLDVARTKDQEKFEARQRESEAECQRKLSHMEGQISTMTAGFLSDLSVRVEEAVEKGVIQGVVKINDQENPITRDD